MLQTWLCGGGTGVMPPERDRAGTWSTERTLGFERRVTRLYLLTNRLMETVTVLGGIRCFNKCSAGFYKHIYAIFGESNAEVMSHVTELLKSDFQLYEKLLLCEIFLKPITNDHFKKHLNWTNFRLKGMVQK